MPGRPSSRTSCRRLLSTSAQPHDDDQFDRFDELRRYLNIGAGAHFSRFMADDVAILVFEPERVNRHEIRMDALLDEPSDLNSCTPC